MGSWAGGAGWAAAAGVGVWGGEEAAALAPVAAACSGEAGAGLSAGQRGYVAQSAAVVCSKTNKKRGWQ